MSVMKDVLIFVVKHYDFELCFCLVYDKLLYFLLFIMLLEVIVLMIVDIEYCFRYICN